MTDMVDEYSLEVMAKCACGCGAEADKFYLGIPLSAKSTLVHYQRWLSREEERREMQEKLNLGSLAKRK